MARGSDPQDELDDLDRQLAGVGGGASREMVRAFVGASPALTGSVRDARIACQTARGALARARDEVDRYGEIEDPATVSLLAWLDCMDELVRFAESVGEVLGD
jgi:hypothetical protein